MKARARRIWIGLGAVAAVLVAAPLLLLAAVQAGAADGLVRGALAAKLGRPVAFRTLSVRPGMGGSRVVFTDLVLGDPPAFGKGELARVPRLELTLKLLPLLVGRLDAPDIAIIDPVLHLRRKGPGNNNYTLGKGGASSSLSATRRLSIVGGRLDMDDPPRELRLEGAITHDAGGALPLHLVGGGVLKGAPFTVDARAGALNGRKPGAPHPVDVTLIDGDTRVHLDGTTRKPFDFDGFDIDFTARGPNAADLDYLFKLSAPNSPPFTMSAHMRKAGKALRATDVRIRTGGTDLAGEIASDHDGPRRVIVARLRSQRLTAADLKIMLSAPPPHGQARSTPGAPGTPRASTGKLFSSTPFSLARLQKEDVRLDYAATAVDGYGPPVRDLSLKLDLTRGKLTLDPVRLSVASGRVAGAFSLDGSARPPRLSVRGGVRDLRLGELTPRGAGVGGRLDLDVDAAGIGASVAAIAADADGRAAFRLGEGALPKKAAAALNGDLFGLLASGKSRVALRCAAGDFTLKDGIATATRLTVGAGQGLASGGGTVNLRNETLALELRASSSGPKPPVQLKAPITLTGPLSHPKASAKLSEASLNLGGLFGALARPFRGERPAPAPTPPPC